MPKVLLLGPAWIVQSFQRFRLSYVVRRCLKNKKRFLNFTSHSSFPKGRLSMNLKDKEIYLHFQ